jgi:hypothetical protein
MPKNRTHTTILISVDPMGDPILDPGPSDECYDPLSTPKERAACAFKKRDVRWESCPKDLDWKVEFRDGTPFQGGHTTFEYNGRKVGRIDQSADFREYKYYLSYTFNGTWKEFDPKIVLEDSGPDILDALEQLRGELEELHARSAQLVTEASELIGLIRAGAAE